ncbi:MAG: hypothetical protein WCO96_04660 [Actinomycetes bacterium]
MNSRLALLLCALAIAPSTLVATGCGSDTKTVSSTGANGQVTSKTVPDVKFAKTKFVLHAGLAFGAIKRWIYNPWQAGTFKSGAEGRTKALIKAAAAAAFSVQQLKSARNAALSDEKLRGVGEKMTGMINQVSSLTPGLKSGSFDPAQIAGLAAGIGGLTALAGDAGAKVKELSAPIPGG